MRFLISALFLSLSPALAADVQTLFFEKVEPKAVTTIALTIEGSQVSGTQHWRPTEQDGAHGTLNGTIKDGLIQVVFEYTIEGSEQSEPQLYKLQGDKLVMGEGELIDPKNNGRLVFKDPAKAEFKKTFKQVPAHEPKAGTPERKAIMDAMRDPVTKDVGKPVIFTGTVRVSGDWAKFDGHVDRADGKPSEGEFELDFSALLRKTKDGGWKPLHWGFAGDISLIEAMREKYPKAPWVLFE